MKLHELQQIYPTAILRAVPADDPNFLSLAFPSGFLWIPQQNLSATEKKLLQQLTQLPTATISAVDHPWYPALFQQAAAPVTEGFFRIIQVDFSALDAHASADWNHEIKSMLPAVVDHFFISEQRCLLIESASDDALSAAELEGLFLALDGDFDTYTRLFVGSFYACTSDFTRLLQEEEQIFNEQAQKNTHTKCFELCQTIVDYVSLHQTQTSYLMAQLYTTWFDEDFPAIIAALWQNQGNVSSAAKDLFMHRNTLQYKIEKFQKRTLLNLKEMNALFLCYLLTTAFHKN